MPTKPKPLSENSNNIARKVAGTLAETLRKEYGYHGVGVAHYVEQHPEFFQSAIEEATKENTFEKGFVAMRDVFLAKCQAESAAIEEATRQAWQEHDDVVAALARANETIKQLGARNRQQSDYTKRMERMLRRICERFDQGKLNAFDINDAKNYLRDAMKEGK